MAETGDTTPGGSIAPRGRGCGQFFIAAIAGGIVSALLSLFLSENSAVIVGIVVGLIVYYAQPPSRVTLADRINRKLDS